MAPEQTDLSAGDPDPRTDVYGLGAILYELLTCRPPFREASDMATLIAVRDRLPTDPRKLRLGLSPDLAAITAKCLEKRVEDRYATVRDLAADLRRFLAGEATHARPLGMLGRSLKWIRLNRIAAALLAVVMLSATTLTIGDCGTPIAWQANWRSTSGFDGMLSGFAKTLSGVKQPCNASGTWPTSA